MTDLAALHESLEAHLDAAFGDVDVASETNMFAVDNAEKADWALRKIARIRRRIADAQQVADAEVERIRTWLDAEVGKHSRDLDFFERLLTAYHRRVLAEDPKAKTIDLPAGTLKARKSPDTIDYVDVDAFVTWAQANRPDLVRTKVEPDKSAAKRTLASVETETGDLVAVDPSTGEAVPGVSWSQGTVTFVVVTDADMSACEAPQLEVVR